MKLEFYDLEVWLDWYSDIIYHANKLSPPEQIIIDEQRLNVIRIVTDTINDNVYPGSEFITKLFYNIDFGVVRYDLNNGESFVMNFD